MKGNGIGDDIVVEYLQMAESTYKEYLDVVMELDKGAFNSLQLILEEKGTFSYIKAKPAKIQVTDGLKAKIRELRNNPDMVDAMWEMVDMATSRTIEQYEAILEAKAKEAGGAARRPIPSSPATKALGAGKSSFKEEPDSADEFDAPAAGSPSPDEFEEAHVVDADAEDVTSAGDITGGDDLGDGIDDPF